jgi:hypothetical protein
MESAGPLRAVLIDVVGAELIDDDEDDQRRPRRGGGSGALDGVGIRRAGTQNDRNACQQKREQTSHRIS